MASPVGHALLGAALARAATPSPARWLYLAGVILALLPDVDLPISLAFTGDAERWHRGPTHQWYFPLGLAILAFATSAAYQCRSDGGWSPRAAALWAAFVGVTVGSHLLADLRPRQFVPFPGRESELDAFLYVLVGVGSLLLDAAIYGAVGVLLVVAADTFRSRTRKGLRTARVPPSPSAPGRSR